MDDKSGSVFWSWFYHLHWWNTMLCITRQWCLTGFPYRVVYTARSNSWSCYAACDRSVDCGPACSVGLPSGASRWGGAATPHGAVWRRRPVCLAAPAAACTTPSLIRPGPTFHRYEHQCRACGIRSCGLDWSVNCNVGPDWGPIPGLRPEPSIWLTFRVCFNLSCWVCLGPAHDSKWPLTLPSAWSRPGGQVPGRRHTGSVYSESCESTWWPAHHWHAGSGRIPSRSSNYQSARPRLSAGCPLAPGRYGTPLVTAMRCDLLGRPVHMMVMWAFRGCLRPTGSAVSILENNGSCSAQQKNSNN